MQDIKYVNHLGEEVSLGRGTYKMLKDTSLLNYDWTHLTKNEYDPTVYAFSRSLVEKDISIRIQSESKLQYIKDLNYLHEIFEKDIYASCAYEAKEEGIVATDDCMLAEAFGFKVKLTDTGRENIKITVSDDISYAEYILRKRGEKEE